VAFAIAALGIFARHERFGCGFLAVARKIYRGLHARLRALYN
jgi:hypothetical protein